MPSVLQELKNLLLEAQKGPQSLQEALKVHAGNHRFQQDELRSLIDSLRLALNDAFTQKNAFLQESGNPTANSPSVPLSALKDLHIGSQRTASLLESLSPQLGQLEQGLGRVESELLSVRRLLETRPHVEKQAGQQQFQRAEKGVQSEAMVSRLEETQRTLGEHIRTNTVFNAVFTYTASALTISAVYLLLRGTG